MGRCIALSATGVDRGELPFAGLVCRGEEVIAEAMNEVAQRSDVTRHAELVAISKSQKVLGKKDLSDCTLYTTVEPCAMCAFAVRETGIRRVVFAIRSPMMGGLSRWNILRDSELSSAMPEVFGSVPEVAAGFMGEEAAKVWHKWNPLVWALIKHRRLLDGDNLTGQELLSAIPPRRGLLRRAFTLLKQLPALLWK